MKVLLPIITLLALSGIFLFTYERQELQGTQSAEELELLNKFVEWKQKFGVSYGSSEGDYRFEEFKKNYNFIQINSTEKLTLGLTKFAAMSNEEYRSNALLQTKSFARMEGATEYPATGKTLPTSIDWVQKGAVYTTQDQGSCGSCWAFSTIGALQGLRYIVTGNLELLSAQQVTSCCPKEWLDDKTQGCNGGEPQYAFQYTADAGIEPASAYPYVNGSGGPAAPCNYNKDDVVFYNKGVGYCVHDDVNSMKENLVNQPLSIAVDAGSIYFQLYSTGIIDSDNCGTDLNHAILLTGYQEDDKTPYWTVQNSWGTGWGQNGFGNVAIKEGDGVCGINMEVSFPTSIDQ